MKHVFLFGLLAVFAFGCGTTETTEQTQTETEVSETPVETTTSTELPSGDNFEIRVLVDTIKSPRKELTGQIGDTRVTINYGSPAMRGRTIYGDLVPYGKVWRTGANEATTITFSDDVRIGGQEVAGGTYALYSKPESKNEWTFILNSNAQSWGAYDYDEALDVVRVDGTATETGTPAERMDFTLADNEVRMHWADLVVSFPVED